jgi:hypothetical protein
MNSRGTWFLLLLAVCMIGPYVFGVRSKRRRDWTYIAITIAFMACMLFMQSIRSR